MKRCPTCQKTFDDNKRFCQIDGTPLVDDIEKSEPVDPYKTVIGGQFNTPSNPPANDPMKTMVVDSKSKEDDLLQIPEVFDPMKTVVVSDPVKSEPVRKDPPPFEPSREPERPKFNEPSLSPPSFGDLSSAPKDTPKVEETPKFNEPPKYDSPFSSSSNEPPKSNDAPKFGSPFSQGSNEPPKYDSPFVPEKQESPKDDPFPPYKEGSGTAPLGEKKDPFHNSAFGLPHIPLEQSYTPPKPAFNPQPAASQQNDWAPPPAPVASWENQQIGSNTPFNPPVAGSGEGENKTMAIISLVCGILSCLCCLSVLTGPAAIILGYMAKGNIDKNPAMYGGRGLAMGGMITGAIGTIIGFGLIILQIFFGVLGNLG